MALKIPITIDGKAVEVESGKTILEICRELEIPIPVMCHFDGLTDVGACRLCLVEVEGIAKLLPACTTKAAANQVIRTNSQKLQQYRRMIVELFFSERNHICAVCVANNNCELQDLARNVGMDHVRFPYLNQNCSVDASHPKYVLDHNRCILCTRCVRVCSEVEGAHNWNIMNRGVQARLIADFNQPWGQSETCTWCSKCLQVCPTGALWNKYTFQGQMEKFPNVVTDLVEKRKLGL